MAKKKDWIKVDEDTRDVRRPTGIRKSTQKIYKQESSGKFLTLTTMPRRPNFISYGRVEFDGSILFEGSKTDAEKYAYDFMENYGNTQLHSFNNIGKKEFEIQYSDPSKNIYGDGTALVKALNKKDAIRIFMKHNPNASVEMIGVDNNWESLM